jgi:hypothetical protein
VTSRRSGTTARRSSTSSIARRTLAAGTRRVGLMTINGGGTFARPIESHLAVAAAASTWVAERIGVLDARIAEQARRVADIELHGRNGHPLAGGVARAADRPVRRRAGDCGFAAKLTGPAPCACPPHEGSAELASVCAHEPVAPLRAPEVTAIFATPV